MTKQARSILISISYFKCEISIYNYYPFLSDKPVDEHTPPTKLCKGVEI